MKYPKVKEMLVPYINEEKTGIRLGGHQMNIARDIEVDDVESFYSLLLSINGKSSIEHIATLNNLSKSDLYDILETLRENGVIYENNSKEYNFSSEELEYYNRNLNLFAWIDVNGLYYNYWEVQNILKNSKVLLLGAGGTGGHCGESLARMGIGDLFIVDCDKVELSNLNRQNFNYDDVGKVKVDVLKNKLSSINPYINVNTKNTKIESVDDILSLNYNADILICCIDQPDNVTSLVESFCKSKKIPWILGGYASTIMTSAISDAETSLSKLIETDIESNYDAKMLSQNKIWKWDNSIISPIANIAGNMSALYCFYYLTKLRNLKSGQIQHIDLFNLQDLENFSYIIGVE